MAAPASKSPTPSRRTKSIIFRIDQKLYDEAQSKARLRGGVSAVLRVMLKRFVRGEIAIDDQELLEELVPAAADRSKPRQKKK